MTSATRHPAGAALAPVPGPPAAAVPRTAPPAAHRTGRPPQAPACLATAARIVIGVDNSRAGLAALRSAVSMARTAGVPLVAVRTWALGLPRHGGWRSRPRNPGHPHVVLFFDGSGQRFAAAEFVRQTFRSALGGIPPDLAITIETPEGDPGRVLSDMAAGTGDILVLGTDHSERARHLVHGSVSRYCSEHAPCPVVLVAPHRAAAR